MKEKFYIFLDIDGVLYDWKYIKSLSPDHHGGIIQDFDPESIAALNYLIDVLKNNYEVELVISSSWRSNMRFTLEILISQGLKAENINISRIGNFYVPSYRGREIIKYLEDKENKGNYVIIDDENFDFKDHFEQNRIVKTNIFISDLKKCMIDEFLKNINKKRK